MSKELEINVENLDFGFGIFKQISQFRPHSSYSFRLDAHSFNAFQEVRQLVNWGMGANMPKMKAAALEILDLILLSSPGEPVNLNFTEHECKSMNAVMDLIGRSLDKHKDGVLRK